MTALVFFGSFAVLVVTLTIAARADRRRQARRELDRVLWPTPQARAAGAGVSKHWRDTE